MEEKQYTKKQDTSWHHIYHANILIIKNMNSMSIPTLIEKLLTIKANIQIIGKF
jgi:hypothetical protein